VILDLGACPDSVLEVCSRFRLEFVKIGIFAIFVGSENFDIGPGMEFRKSE